MSDLVAERLDLVGRKRVGRHLGLLKADHVGAGLLKPLNEPGKPGKHRVNVPGRDSHSVIQPEPSDCEGGYRTGGLERDRSRFRRPMSFAWPAWPPGVSTTKVTPLVAG